MEKKRFLNALVVSIVTCSATFLILVFFDKVLLKDVKLGIFVSLAVSLLTGIVLFPFFLWIRSRIMEEPIPATRLSDLELNDRDIREAVDQWVYVHYKKRAEGVMDFSLDDKGSLACIVTVRDEN